MTGSVTTFSCIATSTRSNAKYLWLYHRNKGAWELARLMWNSSDPAAPVPAQPPPQPR